MNRTPRLSSACVWIACASVALVTMLIATAVFAQTTRASFTAEAFSPAREATAVCPDTPLRIMFDEPPLRGSGTIRVFDAADGRLVDTIDVAAPVKTRTIGGLTNYNYLPVLISGDEAYIELADRALNYGKSYYVTVDAGAFTTATGASFSAIEAPDPAKDRSVWRFTTRSAPPEPKNPLITVAADNSGDFATVQGAIDSIAEGNTTPTTIFVRNGTYREMICLTGKNAITFLGEDRKSTIIAYPNNDRFNNNSGGNPFATTTSAPASAIPRRGGAVYRRGMFLAHRVTDLTIANLTLHNTTPQGGSQAEAIILNGTANAHAIITNVDLDSYQDTLQINGQAYVNDCNITGDVDFMWGTGPCFFENVRATSLRSNAYYTQIRNPPTNHGYIFKDCVFDGAPGVTGNFLSRIEPTRFPASEVVLLNCTMTDAVGPVAWRLDRSTDPAQIHFWEFNSHSPSGAPVDVSKRLAISKQLALPADQQLITDYSNSTFVLGGNWTPLLKPLIAQQPAAAISKAGGGATFKVTAVAVPAPKFQWQKDGRDVEGGTQSTLQIKHVTPQDAGKYSVIVRNSGGTVTSEPAALTVGGD